MEAKISSQALINLGDSVFVRFSLFSRLDEIDFEYPKGVFIEIAEGSRDQKIDDLETHEMFSIPVDRSFDFVKQLTPFYDVIKTFFTEQMGRWMQSGDQLCIDLASHWTLGEPEIKHALTEFSKQYHAFIQNKEVE